MMLFDIAPLHDGASGAKGVMTITQADSAVVSRGEMTADTVFIVCSERSGSNLLRAMLDAHPAIHAPMPVRIGSTIAKKLHQYGDLGRDDAWRRLVQDVLRQMNNAKGRLDVALTEDDLFAAPTERSFCALYKYIYETALAANGKSRLAIKEVHMHRDLGFYLACFPNARFVMQVRDPRDYALSCMSTGRVVTHYGSVVQALDIWVEDQQGALSLMAAVGPRRIFNHTYESLVTSPENVMRQLCEFLQVKYSPSMLAHNEQESAQEAAKRHPTYWGNLAKPILSDNVAKYRGRLSNTTIAFVEGRTKELMEQFGYALETPRLSLVQQIGVASYRLTNWFGLSKQWMRRTLKLLRGRSRGARLESQPQVTTP